MKRNEYCSGMPLRNLALLCLSFLDLAGCNSTPAPSYGFLIRSESSYTIYTKDYAEVMCMVPEGMLIHDVEIMSKFGIPETSVNMDEYVDSSSQYWNLILLDKNRMAKVISVPQNEVGWNVSSSIPFAEYSRFRCVWSVTIVNGKIQEIQIDKLL